MQTLTPHFCLEEFERSATADRLGICNSAPTSVITRLQNLCQQILEPAREAYGTAITIQSGYRCTRLNTAVGGAKNSQHRTGEAADLPYSEELLLILKTLPYDQLIVEVSRSFKVSGGSSGTKWIHVSCKLHEDDNRHQFIPYLIKK